MILELPQCGIGDIKLVESIGGNPLKFQGGLTLLTPIRAGGTLFLQYYKMRGLCGLLGGLSPIVLFCIQKKIRHL